MNSHLRYPDPQPSDAFNQHMEDPGQKTSVSAAADPAPPLSKSKGKARPEGKPADPVEAEEGLD